MQRAHNLDFGAVKTVFFPVVHPAREDLAGARGKHGFNTLQIAMVFAIVELHRLE